MSESTRQSKLDELRRKTDGNLANIIHRELAFGIELTTENDFDSADHATSEQAYAVAMKFLTTLADPADVAALHQKASQLRKAIDELELDEIRESRTRAEVSPVNDGSCWTS